MQKIKNKQKKKKKKKKKKLVINIKKGLEVQLFKWTQKISFFQRRYKKLFGPSYCFFQMDFFLKKYKKFWLDWKGNIMEKFEWPRSVWLSLLILYTLMISWLNAYLAL